MFDWATPPADRPLPPVILPEKVISFAGMIARRLSGTAVDAVASDSCTDADRSPGADGIFVVTRNVPVWPGRSDIDDGDTVPWVAAFVWMTSNATSSSYGFSRPAGPLEDEMIIFQVPAFGWRTSTWA